MYYFEQKSVIGGWSPCTSENKPFKPLEGRLARIRNVVEFEYKGETLDELYARFNGTDFIAPKGNFPLVGVSGLW